MLSIRLLADKILRPHSRYPFINSAKRGGKLLDVGCGDNSPNIIKKIRSDIYYIGLDIELLSNGQNYKKCANELIITDPENFHLEIAKHLNEFDAITSVHNLEHCNNFIATTIAMINALKIGGRIYISFPSEDSINFPSRYGTLNFYDDKTHKNIIKYLDFISLLKKSGLKILYSKKKYQPIIPYVVGFLCEPFCKLLNKQAPIGGTWAYYGFETVIIAEKN